ncbi:Pr6Pr family membrane protein [Kineosporia sp. R_H_3]|uniref:Pr6Pr family membrane protein n=1 Tax=Kineosporia sp. R_H_3 TaxID=1961848 RepID=UPI000B4B625C|nr:Pr6Pr family membrane protein [Kineosporia sp. R_H_3]
MVEEKVAGGAVRPVRDLALPPGAAWFHLATAVVTTAALVLQFVLTTTTTGQPLPVRWLRLASYFTIQSNLLVAVAAWALWLRPARGVRLLFKVVRLDGLVGITVTGLVYVVVLRPTVDLDGWWAVADTLLHYVVPLLAVVGWAVYGPRRRTDRRVVLLALVWPVAWFAWTLAHGAVAGFYPYPFVDVDDLGYGSVLGNAALVTALLLAAAAAYLWADRWLDARARRPRWIA